MITPMIIPAYEGGLFVSSSSVVVVVGIIFTSGIATLTVDSNPVYPVAS